MQELIQHAQDHVWCNGRVDRYVNVLMSRLGLETGIIGMIPEPQGVIPLPGIEAFHVFSLGDLNFSRLGFPNYVGDWVNIAQISTQQSIEVNVTNNVGQRILGSECFMTYGTDNSLLLAIRRSPIIDTLMTEDMRFSSYRNVSSLKGGNYYTNGRVVTDEASGLLIYNEYLQAKALGTATLYRNGFIVEDIHPSEIKYKDAIHYEARTYGLSHTRYAISDLESFNSKVDAKRKLLVHLPEVVDRSIHFYNDLDIKLFQIVDGVVIGINIFTINEGDIRMVTHHDIAISNDMIERFINNLPSDFKPTHLSVTVKSSGMEKVLTHERYFIHELYKLPEELIYPNMITESNRIPEWNAIMLEQSTYNRIMEQSDFVIDDNDVIDAYGYNGVCMALERSPLVVPKGDRTVQLPPCLKTNSTFFEYNAKGEWVDTKTNYNVAITTLPDSRCLDGLFGTVTNRPLFTYNKQVSDVTDGVTYRFLIAKKISGERVEYFRDAVEGEDYFIANGRVTWYSNLTSNDVVTIANTQWPLFELSVSEERLSFDLNTLLNDRVGFVLDIAVFAYFELWINDKRAIESIDYTIVDHWLHIHTKEFFTGDNYTIADNTFKLLMNGFSNSKFERGILGDTGFVRLNKLSANHSYNLMDGVNGTFIYHGGVFCREDVTVEDYSKVGDVELTNGLPYQFHTRMVTTNGLDWDRWGMYYESLDLARRIEVYFNSLMVPKILPITPIKRLYPLVSITLHRIISDMKTARLRIPHERLTDTEIVDKWLVPYELEIANDICKKDFGENSVFVEIQPHGFVDFMDVTPMEYDFISRVNSLIFNNRIVVERYLRIGRT